MRGPSPPLLTLAWVPLRPGTPCTRSLQLKHPNIVPTRYNPSQVYGSKYVTVVVTGEDGGVVTRAYQATAQAMAMVRGECKAEPVSSHPSRFARKWIDGCFAVWLPLSVLRLPVSPATFLRATLHVPLEDDIVGVQDPSHVSLRPTSEEQYVPDVFHKHIDEFGNEAKAKAEPAFPVEFLMVDLESGGYLDAENSTFPVADRPFPTENRQEIAPLDHGAIRAHLEQDAPLLAKLSDFHLLVYLVTDDMCSMVRLPCCKCIWVCGGRESVCGVPEGARDGGLPPTTSCSW